MKLLIRNLDRLTTEAELKSLFEDFGIVQSCRLVIELASGKSKGFGFVEMSDGGENAIQALNDAEVDGRKLVVNESRPRD